MVDFLNNILWSYVLIVGLIGVGIYFSAKTKFAQFTMLNQQQEGHLVQLLCKVLKEGYSPMKQGWEVLLMQQQQLRQRIL